MERESGGGGPFQGLENRFGFVDIRVCSPRDQSKGYRYTLFHVVNYNFETRGLMPFDLPGKEKRFCGLGTITRPREQYQKVMDVRDFYVSSLDFIGRASMTGPTSWSRALY